MRRQSLRPRNIDIHQHLTIARSIDDLVLDDENGNIPKITSLNQLSSIIDDQPVKTKRKKIKSIPIPFVATVDVYEKEVPANYDIPSSYVRFQKIPKASEENNRIEVDLEVDDMKWLREHPKYGEDGDPRYQVSMERLEQMLDILEKASGPIYPNLVTLNEAEELFRNQMNLVKNPLNKVTVDIYNYWVQKRHAKKKPLVRRFWPQTPLNDTNPHLVFRPREKERYKLRKHRKNDMAGFRKLLLLRQDFDRVRILAGLVKRREKCKRLGVDFLDEIRKQTIADLTNLSGKSRKPKIPMEEERDGKQKKKKKKKKKSRKESVESSSPSKLLSTPGSGTDGNSGILTSSKPDGTQGNNIMNVEPLHVPNFMEYEPKSSITKISHEPYFPCYPSPSTILPRDMLGPPKYRCRGRIGRGGRLIIDRIPASEHLACERAELYARPSLYDTSPHAFQRASMNTSSNNLNSLSTSSLPNNVNKAHGSTSSSNNSSLLHSNTSTNHHHATTSSTSGVTNATSQFQPTLAAANAMSKDVMDSFMGKSKATISTTRLNEIYDMSDSENEILEPSPTVSMFIDTKKPLIDRSRPIKYTLKL